MDESTYIPIEHEVELAERSVSFNGRKCVVLAVAHRLVLAARCTAEVPTKSEDSGNISWRNRLAHRELRAV